MAPKTQTQSLNKAQTEYISKMTNSSTFWFGMLAKLPSAVFWGFRMKSLSLEKCEITIPYMWRTQNPFKSIYFAALAGAAELSTGALCLLSQAGKGKYSMLVVDFRAEYFKKANQKITFTCEQGLELNEVIDALEPNESNKLTMISTGMNPNGEVVARFHVTWSFKRKS